MALLTTYSAANKVVLSGKTQRVTCGAPSDPTVTATASSDGTITVTADAWYEMICHSTASFAYVGMTYAAASACRDAMVAKFTRLKAVWEYTTSTDTATGTVTLGWVRKTDGATVQEAEVGLEPTGGSMYQVRVNVDCEDVVMTTSPSTQTFAYPACMADVD